MSFDILEGLNPHQREAVTETEGYVRVVAGAGTGKTGTLSRRFMWLVDALGISTSGILCATFTNKAAFEMKKRIRRMLPDRDLGYITTFHGFCVTLLKEDCSVVSYPPAFLVLDNEDRDAMLRTVFDALGVTGKELTIEDAAEAISIYKGGHDYVPLLTQPDSEALLRLSDESTGLKDRVMFRFFYEQRKCYGLDFDDLIYFALYILRTDPEVREKWQRRMEYVMVDEYQDIDKDQYAIAEILSGYHQNLFVVGDPDQTIYTWRGADVKFMLEFDIHHPGTKTILLTQNYRSTPQILAASNALIEKNAQRIRKDLLPTRSDGPLPQYYHAKTQALEAEWITDLIQKHREKGVSLSDMAILYRAHYISRAPEEALVKARIPYVLYSGTEFYRRKEVKDVLAYLRMICSGDDASFLRTVNEPRRSIGKKRLERIRACAEENHCSLYTALIRCLDEPLIKSTKAGEYVRLIEKFRALYLRLSLTDLLNMVLQESGYEEALRISGQEERLDNLAELKQAVYDYEKTAGEAVGLSDYLARVALFSGLDRSEEKQRVRLMTVHAAKGLEFSVVFVCGLSEGMFPSKRTLTPEGMEEERRLAYVAMTRAKDHLYLSDAAGSGYEGAFRHPSRFIFNAGEENLEFVVPLDRSLIVYAEEHGQLSGEACSGSGSIGYRVREKVVHPVFGPGEIIDISDDKTILVIQFDRFPTPRSISSSMKLEKL